MTNYRILSTEFQLSQGVLTTYSLKPSKSGSPNRHIVVDTKIVLHPVLRLALQCMLGSDRKHELLSYIAMTYGHAEPTLFFEAK